MSDSIGWQIILQIILIAMNAIFACAEIAVISVNGNKLEKLAQGGNKRAQRLEKLTNKPARFLATIQVAITLSGFLGSAFAADNFSDMLTNAILNTGVAIPEKTLDTISVVLITIILSFFTLVFGELVPKRLAMRKSESIALGISGLVSFISKLFAPIVWLLTASTNLILKILGVDPDSDDEEISEEEIRMMADAGSEKGVIDEEENQIIQNIFEFDDISAGEIATHRTEMDLLWNEDDVDTWRDILNKTNHTYYPICDETVDNIIGVLDSRLFYRLTDTSRDNIMKSAVKEADIVPESMGADVLLNHMRKTHEHFVIVADEFGGTYGIVTITDLVEKIIGDFSEESEEEIKTVDDDEYIVLGSTDIDKFEKYFDIDLDADSATVGGWVTEELNKIPEEGDFVAYENLTITVTKTNGRQIFELTVKTDKNTEGEV